MWHLQLLPSNNELICLFWLGAPFTLKNDTTYLLPAMDPQAQNSVCLGLQFFLIPHPFLFPVYSIPTKEKYLSSFCIWICLLCLFNVL